jgi:predicted TIM-barrel enzyme
MVELVFLGCGGGRYMTIDQIFNTGGFRIHDTAKIHVDPGPGALLLTHQHGLNPLDLDCIVATHCHPDHYCDADALIVSGKLTGWAPELEKVKKAKEFARDTPVLVGSGTTASNVKDFLKYADGIIVGTDLKKEGVNENPVDISRVKKYMQAVRKARKK